MVITYSGGECIKISQGDLTVAINPPAKESVINVAKFGSNIAITSFDHKDFNGVETASLGDRKPFVISGPGEYDVSGVSVRGFGAEKSTYEKKNSINTIYVITFDGINICFLGAMSQDELPKEAKQEIESVHILFTPIGGDGVLDYASAAKLAVKLEPNIIIPIHYGKIGQKDALKLFLKEIGSEEAQHLDKLTIKRKDIEGKEAEVIVLNEQ